MRLLSALSFYFALFVLSFSFSSFAQSAAPPRVNFQGVLVDDGGNVLHDIQETDLELSIIDGAGTVLYTEVQHVPVIHGAVSVLVGRGTSEGIPYEAFEPEGTKLLRVKLVDQSVPQEDLELASVPYAIYAEKLTSDVTTDIILDGTITQADLSQDLLDYIDSRVVVPEGVTEARMIRVENVFINAGGNNVQDVLQGLDNAISIRLNQDDEIGQDIDAERIAREAAITAERTAREAAITAERAERDFADTAERTAREAAITTERAERDFADTAERTARETTDTVLQVAMPPIGSIMPFYDFGGLVTIDTERWAFCDGSVINDPESPLNGQTLPDLSNRYLVGFGTEGGGDIDTATWGTSAVGNTSHQVSLQHSHAVDPPDTTSGTESASHTHTGPSHSHTGPSHSHTAGTLKFRTLYTHYNGGDSADFYAYDTNGNLLQITAGEAGDGGGQRGLNNSDHLDKIYYTSNGSGTTGLGGTGSTGLGGTGATGTESVTHTHNTDIASFSSGDGDPSLATQTIQPRSIRVRFIMRIK